MTMSVTPPRIQHSQYRAIARLLSYARPYWKGWTLVAATSLAVTILSLAQPWPLKILVDDVFPTSAATKAHAWVAHFSKSQLIAAVALTSVVIFGFNAIAEAVLAQAWVRVGQRMVYDLAGDMFGRI